MFFLKERKQASWRTYARALFSIVLLAGFLIACNTTNETPASNDTNGIDESLIATITNLIEQEAAALDSTPSTNTSDRLATQATSCLTLPNRRVGFTFLRGANYQFYLGNAGESFYDMGLKHSYGTYPFQIDFRLERGGRAYLALGYYDGRGGGDLKLRYIRNYENENGWRDKDFSEVIDMSLVPAESRLVYALFFVDGNATSDLQFGCSPEIDRVEFTPPKTNDDSHRWTIDIYGKHFANTVTEASNRSIRTPNVNLYSREGKSFPRDLPEDAGDYLVTYLDSSHVQVRSPIDIDGEWGLDLFYANHAGGIDSIGSGYDISNDFYIPLAGGFQMPKQGDRWKSSPDLDFGSPNCEGQLADGTYYGCFITGEPFHMGEDWNWTINSGETCDVEDDDAAIYAASDGKVVASDTLPGWGDVFIIRHKVGDCSDDDQEACEFVDTLYGHVTPMDDIDEVGRFVRKGQQVGIVMDWSIGCDHLHFELRDAKLGYQDGYHNSPTQRGWYDPSDWINSNSGLNLE